MSERTTIAVSMETKKVLDHVVPHNVSLDDGIKAILSIYTDALAPDYFRISASDFAKAVKENKSVEQFFREVFSGGKEYQDYAEAFISEAKK